VCLFCFVSFRFDSFWFVLFCFVLMKNELNFCLTTSVIISVADGRIYVLFLTHEEHQTFGMEILDGFLVFVWSNLLVLHKFQKFGKEEFVTIETCWSFHCVEIAKTACESVPMDSPRGHFRPPFFHIQISRSFLEGWKPTESMIKNPFMKSSGSASFGIKQSCLWNGWGRRPGRKYADPH